MDPLLIQQRLSDIERHFQLHFRQTNTTEIGNVSIKKMQQ
ncbi:Uncharacterised protein [Serratia fonticola]|nr:Uncharacterised protein [Serratia fonticola]